MAFGVTPTGFVLKSLSDIRDEMEADLRATVSAGINLETVSPTGQILGAIAGQIAEVWEVTEEVFQAGRPSASGFALDGVCAITGTIRRPGTVSEVAIECDLDPGAIAPAGSRIQVDGDATRIFLILEDIENTGASPATISGVAVSQEVGPIRANTGTLTVILDPAAGWTAVSNPSDATLGQLIANDAELRVDREAELASAGSTTGAAIRADILRVAGVTSASVVENDSDTVVDSIPAHSIEAIVLGGTDPDIGYAILAAKSAAMGTYGTSSIVVPDPNGVNHLISFTRPAPVNVYLAVTITGQDPIDYPGDDAVKQALIDYQETRPPGTDVMVRRLIAVVMGLPGIVGRPEADVTIALGLSPSPVGTVNLSITSRQIADFDTSRITVSS